MERKAQTPSTAGTARYATAWPAAPLYTSVRFGTPKMRFSYVVGGWPMTKVRNPETHVARGHGQERCRRSQSGATKLYQNFTDFNHFSLWCSTAEATSGHLKPSIATGNEILRRGREQPRTHSSSPRSRQNRYSHGSSIQPFDILLPGSRSHIKPHAAT